MRTNFSRRVVYFVVLLGFSYLLLSVDGKQVGAPAVSWRASAAPVAKHAPTTTKARQMLLSIVALVAK